MPVVDATYVKKLYEELRQELEGLHIKIREVEELRYLEDKIALGDSEKVSGIEVRAGLTGELIENVKAALTTNIPRVVFEPLRTGDKAKDNSSARELFWGNFIKGANYPVPVMSELADAQGGLGIGILKMAYYPWPKKERKRLPKEPDKDFLDRQRGLKRLWGPPFKCITVHPLSFFFRLGAGNQLAEVIEHSWKPRREVYKAYGIESDASLAALSSELKISPESGPPMATVAGQPTENVRSLPYGANTTTMALVTEYWSPDIYQCYVDNRLIFEESPPTVKYFIALGRTTSSKDPDKLAQSVAELLRHNEPTINRMLTRMAEATELLVRKRLTLELPEGTLPETELGEDNQPQAKTYRFKADVAESLPSGSRIVDPYTGAENVYQAMPMLQLLLELTSKHGVSPIFKGVPPGAAGSGYRDNSLYLMARSQFQYILDSFSNCIEGMIEWGEQLLVKQAKQEVWSGEFSLSPADITNFPCKIIVAVDPALPQNIIAEGTFWDRMHARGHIPRRMLLEEGLRKGQPELIVRERMLEDLKDQLMPVLYQDVLQAVGILPPTPAPTGNAPQLVGPDGQPMNGASGTQALMSMDPAARAAILQSNQSAGGMSRAGQSREPGAGQHPGELGGGV